MLKIFFHINATLVLINNLRDKKVLEHFGARLKELSLKKRMNRQ